MVGRWVEAAHGRGALRSLLVDGVIGGVGSVLAFLPQILILFLFIAVLEDCGYMARAAFLMDRLMVRVGLSGKSFIPMLSSFACAVPGIMATRVIENERDRLTTILVAPLLTCSARLPVYALLIAAFIPARNLLGRAAEPARADAGGAVCCWESSRPWRWPLLLKRTLLRGQTPPFLMELPSYKWPSPRTVLSSAWPSGAGSSCARAGTLILAVSILVWAALYYPHDRQRGRAPLAKATSGPRAAQLATAPAGRARGDEQADRQLTIAIAARDGRRAYQQHSLLGRLGRVIEPAVTTAGLGLADRLRGARLAAGPRDRRGHAGRDVRRWASEVDADVAGGRSASCRRSCARPPGTARTSPVFTMPVALSIMVFFALCRQCARRWR